MVTLLCFIRQYTLYVGYFLLIIGIFGNSMNIYILSAVTSYRSTPSTFYFLIGSVYNLIIIIVSLISRIMETGYGLELSNSSIIWCKIRQYFITSISIIPVYCQCFATIDRFLITSQHQRLRQYSTIKQVYWISICLTIICLIHGIPFYLYYDISPKTHQCSSMNDTLSFYLPIFVLVIFLFIPTTLTIIFGFLTYRNVKQLRGCYNQHIDRQITLMICMQIILIIWSTIPYGIFTIYSLVTIKIVKDADRLYKELLFFTIVSLNTHVHTGVCMTEKILKMFMCLLFFFSS
jgi:hypothetical protein